MKFFLLSVFTVLSCVSFAGNITIDFKKSPLQGHITHILKKTTPMILEKLHDLEIKDSKVLGDYTCDEVKYQVGKNGNCFYLPNLLIATVDSRTDEIINDDQDDEEKESDSGILETIGNAVGDVADSVGETISDMVIMTKSRSVILELIDMKLKNIKVDSINVLCEDKNDEFTCRLNFSLKNLSFETGLRLLTNSGQRILGTVSKQLITIKKSTDIAPSISMNMYIKKGLVGRETFYIPSGQVKIDVLQSDIHFKLENNEDDIESAIQKELSKRSEIKGEFGEISKDEVVRVENQIKKDFELFLEYRDLIYEHALTQDRGLVLIHKITPALGKIISEALLKVFNKHLEVNLDVPLKSVQDSLVEEKLISYFSGIKVTLATLISDLEEVQGTDAILSSLPNVSRYYTKLSKIFTHHKNSRIEEINITLNDEVNLINSIDQIIINSYESSKGKKQYRTEYSRYVKSRDELFESITLFKESMRTTQFDDITKLKLIPNFIDVLDNEKTRMAVSLNQKIDDMSVFEFETPESCKGEEDFVFSISIDWINNYLKQLYERGMFSFCVNDQGGWCFEEGDTDIQVKFKSAPKFVETNENGKYILKIDEIKTNTKLSGINLKNIPLLRSLTSDKIEITVDFNQVRRLGGPLIGPEHIQMQHKAASEIYETLALTILSPISVVVTIANYSVRKAFLESILEDKSAPLSQTLDNKVSEFDTVKINEIFSQNGRIFLFGNYMDFSGEIKEGHQAPQRCLN